MGTCLGPSNSSENMMVMSTKLKPPGHEPNRIMALRWVRPPMRAICMADTNMLVNKKPLDRPNGNCRGPNTNRRRPNTSPKVSQWNLVRIGYVRVFFMLGM